MNFSELVLKRQSVRKYKNQIVEPEKLARCIESARLSPSACNAQPWKFIIVDEPKLKEQVANETFGTLVSFNKFAVQAPILIVLVIEKPNMMSQIGGRVKDKDFYLMDVGMVAEHFCLQAADEGLGTCMMGWFNESKIAKLLNVPKKKRIALVITLGYADDENRNKIRKETSQILSYNSY